jgi:hypothetical protein
MQKIKEISVSRPAAGLLVDLHTPSKTRTAGLGCRSYRCGPTEQTPVTTRCVCVSTSGWLLGWPSSLDDHSHTKGICFANRAFGTRA